MERPLVRMVSVSFGADQTRAILWTFEEGFKSLGASNEGYTCIAGEGVISCKIDMMANSDHFVRTYIEDINNDGSVIVGYYSDSQTLQHAFVWTSEEGMHNLCPMGQAKGVNVDGSRIVCQQQGRRFPIASLWTMGQKESVEELLNNNNILLPFGWALTMVTSITPNGVVLTGMGNYNDQMEEGFPLSISNRNDFNRLRELQKKAQPRAWRAIIPKPNLF